MISFREFLDEGGYNVPVVSLSKDKVNLSKPDTRNEINRNLAAELSRSWMSPYGGWAKIRKVLSMYSIDLPKIIFQDEEEGEEVVAIHQFGEVWGATVDGRQTSPNESEQPDFFLYYSYGIGMSGFYECYAKVVDEEGLNSLLSTDFDDVDFEGPEGERDPRQP